MQAGEKFKLYFQMMQQSIVLVKQLKDELDSLYKSSVHMDFERNLQANKQVDILATELSQLHEQRRKIAGEFGCSGDKFSLELAKKLPEKVGLHLTTISRELIGLMDECKEKLNTHSEQLQLQKKIVSEAVESMNLTVSA